LIAVTSSEGKVLPTTAVVLTIGTVIYKVTACETIPVSVSTVAVAAVTVGVLAVVGLYAQLWFLQPADLPLLDTCTVGSNSRE